VCYKTANVSSHEVRFVCGCVCASVLCWCAGVCHSMLVCGCESFDIRFVREAESEQTNACKLDSHRNSLCARVSSSQTQVTEGILKKAQTS